MTAYMYNIVRICIPLRKTCQLNISAVYRYDANLYIIQNHMTTSLTKSLSNNSQLALVFPTLVDVLVIAATRREIVLATFLAHHRFADFVHRSQMHHEVTLLLDNLEAVWTHELQQPFTEVYYRNAEISAINALLAPRDAQMTLKYAPLKQNLCVLLYIRSTHFMAGYWRQGMRK